MAFTSDFIVHGNGAYANEKVVFEDSSEIGAVVDSDNLGVDGPFTKDELNLNDYTVTKITKYQWVFGDGNYFYENLVTHKFKTPGQIQIRLKVWSELFYKSGQSFYFTSTVTREITVQGRFYKFLTDNFPIWDQIKNTYYDTIFQTVGNFFDKMHEKISGIYNLTNIQKIDPNYFEVLAQTLGHESYLRKVGYSPAISGNFAEYDIIDRIANNIATQDEITSFRIFLGESASLFKKKGTPEDIERFLSYFSINGNSVDLWTKNFGKSAKGEITENFSCENFKDNALTLSWSDINVFGTTNDLGHLVKNEKSIVIDSYYKSQVYEQDKSVFTIAPIVNDLHPEWDAYELVRYVKEVKFVGDTTFTPIETWMTPNEVSDLIGQLYTTESYENIDLESEQKRIVFDDRKLSLVTVDVSSQNCTITQEVTSYLVKYIPTFMVRDIRLDDGSEVGDILTNNDINTYLVDWRSITPCGSPIVVDVTGLPLSGYFQYYPYLQVQNFLQLNDLLENGERMSISYLVPNDKDVECATITKSYKAKNFDLITTFSFGKPDDLTYNKKNPDNQINVIFRGIKDSEENNQVNTYYKLIVNGRESTCSLCKVVPNVDDTVINQKINLTGDRDNIINESVIYGSGNTSGSLFTFNSNVSYQVKISIVDSTFSAWVRELKKESEMNADIYVGLGNNYFGKDVRDEEWINIINNLDLDATQENVTSYNLKNQVIDTVRYEYIDTEGYLGVGSMNSALIVDDIYINNLDLDTTLYDTVEKQVHVKPKYLEWQRQRDIILSSYDNTIPYFDSAISEKFDSTVKKYQLSDEEASSLQTIYYNNIQVDDKLATRYTVWFDKAWLKDNYFFEEKLNPDFFNKIVVPFGTQKAPFFTENTVYNENMYKDTLGGDTSGCGHFIANNSIVLDTYETTPHDAFSSLTRSDDGFGTELTINERVQQYKLSGMDIGFKGVYEEITPLSNYFVELDGKLTLNDQTQFKNFLFNPVVVETECGRRTIGVRFRNCKDILTVIDHYSTELQKEILIYGNFTFHVPKYAVAHAPDKDFTQSDLLSDYVQYNQMIPLGILNEHIKTYNLSKPFVKEYGGMMIILNGVYVKLNSDQVSYSSSGKITLKTTNPYENKYNNLTCRYWLCADMTLHSSVYTESEIDFEDGQPGANFFLNKELRKLMTTLEDTKTYNITSDYRWWLPKENSSFSGVYRKRNYDIITVNLSQDLTTNINYFGYDSTPMVDCEEQRNRAAMKVLFGNKVGGFDFSQSASFIPNAQCVTAADTLKAIQIRLTDGDVSKPMSSETPYYAKISVRMNYSGFDQEDIDILPENERKKLKILGTTKKEKFKKAPVVKCLTFFVPFAWYDSNHLPHDNIIEYANYIRGSYGSGDVPTITMVPFGLMTQLLDKMDKVDKEYVLQSGIDFTEWNKYLLENLSIDGIYEPLPTSICKLYANYGIFNELDINLGAYVEIEYNKSTLDWDVTDKFRYFFDGKKENFFPLPNEINSIESWITNLRNVTLNNYVLSKNNYTIAQDNTLNLSNDDSFVFLDGSTMVGKYMLNLYLNVFNTTQNNFTFETYDQNFNTKNGIDFVPYESTSNTPYKIVERESTEDLVFSSGDNLYSIITVGGYQAMKVNTSNTNIKAEAGKTGTATAIKNINLNLSPLPDIQKLFILDEDSPVFDMQADVYFDEQLDKIGDYRGKKLEFIIKANSAYNTVSKEYNLSEYYFVGIGTYDFDIALGLAKYDAATNTFKKTFLAGFGDYNTKNIKSNTWYKLRTIVTKDYIRVIYNASKEAERLVINYAISPKNSDMAGINSGKYEELVYLIKGLPNMDITYLDKVGIKAGSDFVNGNIDVDLATNTRPAGYMAGFTIFNDYTYVTNISYKVQKPKIRKFSNVCDQTDHTLFLTKISQKFGAYNELLFVGKTLNNTLVVQADDILYHSDANGDPVQYIKSGVIETDIYQNYVVVRTILDDAMNVIVIPESFKNEINVFLKDNNFDIDHIFKYLLYTDKSIDEIYVNNGQISVVFNT